MLVSFIIPAYNAADTIVRCLESIYGLSLKRDEFEVIVIDDCSTDNTCEIVSKYQSQHPNITLLKQPKNNRQGAARNRGVKVAEGEDGSTSSWLSDGLINVQALGFQNAMYTQADFQDDILICTDWINHPFRKWLNENLYDAMPNAIKNTIKEVDKAFKSYNIAPEAGWYQQVGGVQLLDKSSIDKIWVPSMAEMKTIVEAASNYSSYSQYMEMEGIDYSQVFVPAYGAVSAGFRTATLPGGRWDTVPPRYIHYRSDQGLDGINYEYAPFGFCL